MPAPALMLEALLEFGLKRELAGCRPSRIEVADEALATYLRDALTDAGVAVSVTKDLAALKDVLAHLAEHMSGKPLPPNAMDGSGVTVERVRAFATAASDFFRAAPWRHLSGEDLVHVESPVAAGLRHLTVLGGAEQTFGLGLLRKAGRLRKSLRCARSRGVFRASGQVGGPVRPHHGSVVR